MTVEEQQVRATHRRPTSECGIGVAAKDVTERDRDGQRFRLVVTDTINGFAVVDAIGAGHLRFTAEQVEAQVEHRAGAFPIETRMRDLVAAGPIALRADD